MSKSFSHVNPQFFPWTYFYFHGTISIPHFYSRYQILSKKNILLLQLLWWYSYHGLSPPTRIYVPLLRQ